MPVSITRPTVPGLVDLARVRRAIGWTPGKTTQHDELLQLWIDTWSRQFKDDAEQPIAKETIVGEEFQGNGRDEYTLSHWPVSNLSKLEREVGFNEWEEIPADAYVLRGDGACRWIRINGWFIDGVSYRATYDVGYDRVPPNIATIVLNAVVLEYLESKIGEGRLGTVSKSIAGVEGVAGESITFSREEFRRRWNTLTTKYAKVPTVG